MGSVSRVVWIEEPTAVLRWESIPPPRPIPDVHHLKRHLRYVALNPCRSSLCRDPLEWHWSTYREVVGATTLRTGVTDRMRRALRIEPSQTSDTFAQEFHRYVSSDPSVAVSGTPFPQGARTAELAHYSLGAILNAAAASLRCAPAEVTRPSPLRPLFLHLAARCGWDRPSTLSQVTRLHRSSVHRILNLPSPPSLAAAWLCLGDDRLRRMLPPLK